jgi:hypothetical protein
VSSESHFATSRLASGAKLIEPPTCRIMSGTATRSSPEQLVEHRQALASLAVRSRTWTCSTVAPAL